MRKIKAIILGLAAVIFLAYAYSGCSDDKSVTNPDSGNNDTLAAVDTFDIYTPDSTITFEYFRDTNYLNINNAGNVDGTYKITFGDQFFSADSIMGNISPGQNLSLNLILDRSAIPSDTLPRETYLSLTIADSLTDSLPVYISNYKNDFWHIDFRVIDAEYCRATDKIYAVSGEPNQFHIIDPESREIISLPLSKTPKCIAVRTDGYFAVVGHDSLVTYIELISNQVYKTIPLNSIIYDIILPINGWTYTFPGASINLAHGLVYPHKQGGSWVQLHPSQYYIYRNITHVTPVSMYKYDIRTDTLHVMYESNKNAFGYKHWISDDGKRIYSQGDIFRLTDNPASDFLYNGSLSKSILSNWIEHSTAANRVYAADNSGKVINIYESDYNDYQGTKYLEKYIVRRANYTGVLYQLQANFCFASKDGSRLHLLTHVESGAGLLHDWFIISYNTADLY